MTNLVSSTKTNVFADVIGAMNTMRLENLIYQLAEKSLEGYKGGQWEFVKTACDARYMRFPYSNTKTLEFGYNSARMGSDAAGIALTLMALSHFSFYLYEKESPDTDSVSQMFHDLRDYAISHGEAHQIFAFID